jgi:predicted dehydrogenase
MSHPTSTNRRDFTKSLSAGVAIGTAAGGFFTSAAIAAEKKSLGIALVGLGKLATNQIAPALQTTKYCHLAGIVTGTPEKEKIWSEKYNISSDHIYNYQNFDKIIGDASVDVVYVVLPNSMHEEYTIRAAKAGKHVLCEKPMANSAAECQRMIAACESASRKLAIGYRCQFEPHHLQSIELLRSHELGAIRSIDAGFAFPIGDPTQWRLRSKLAGGGALMDVGIYALQAARYLSGEEPISVTAQETKTNAVKFAEVDESITWVMNFASGIKAHCSTSYNFQGLNQVNVHTEKGFVKLGPAFSYEGIQGETSLGPMKLPAIDQFAAEMDAFSLCIRENRPNRVSGEEGLRDLKIIEAIYRSIKEGKTIAVV